MKRLHTRLLALPLAALAVAAVPAKTPAPGPHGRTYVTAPPMDETVEQRIAPQVEGLIAKLLRERRQTKVDGVSVFDSGDKFLPARSPG